MQRMVRSDDYKLIVYPKARKILLFDLNKDPLEMNNLAENAAFKEVKEELIVKLKKQMVQMDDPLDLHPYFPELF